MTSTRKLLMASAAIAIALIASACSSTDHSEKPTRPESSTYSESDDSTDSVSNLVDVKYVGAVDVGNYDWLPGQGSLVEDAWFDPASKELVIDLGSASYRYCGVSAGLWGQFKNADSLGSFYNDRIKDSYDCREASSAADAPTSATTTTLDPATDEYFEREFSGPLAEAARATFWMYLMNGEGGYDAPTNAIDDGVWMTDLMDAVAANNDGDCDAWNRALDLHLSSEDTYEIRPAGWSREDAHYELVASVLSFSSGKGFMGQGGPAYLALSDCHDFSEGPPEVNRLLTEVVPTTWKAQKAAYAASLETMLGESVNPSNLGSDGLMITPTASKADFLATEKLTTCDDWMNEAIGGFGGPERAIASILAASDGPARMLLMYCGTRGG